MTFKTRDAKKKFYTGLAWCSGIMLVGVAVAGIAAPLAVIKNDSSVTQVKTPVTVPWSTTLSGSIGNLQGQNNFVFPKKNKNEITMTQVALNGKTKNAVEISAPAFKNFLDVNSSKVFYQWYIKAAPASGTTSSTTSSTPVSYVGFSRLLGDANSGTNAQTLALNWSLNPANSGVTTSNNFSNQTATVNTLTVSSSDFVDNATSPTQPNAGDLAQVNASSFYLIAPPTQSFYIFAVMYYPVSPNEAQIVNVSNIAEITTTTSSNA